MTIVHGRARASLLQFVKDTLHIHRLEAAIHLVPDHHDRGKPAGPHTPQAVQGEFPVRCRLPYVYAENALEFVEELLGTAHITGRSHTHRNRVPAFGRHGEEGIECNYPVDLGHRDIEPPGYHALHLLGEIAHKMLRFMKYVYEFPRVVTVPFTDGVHLSGDIAWQFDFWHNIPFFRPAGQC